MDIDAVIMVWMNGSACDLTYGRAQPSHLKLLALLHAKGLEMAGLQGAWPLSCKQQLSTFTGIRLFGKPLALRLHFLFQLLVLGLIWMWRFLVGSRPIEG